MLRARADFMSAPRYDRGMKNTPQELPFRRWGGARKGAGRKRQSPRPTSHRPRCKFRKGALHVTLRIRREAAREGARGVPAPDDCSFARDHLQSRQRPRQRRDGELVLGDDLRAQ